MSAILGEMTKVDGRICIDGSVAYVAQTAWIINASLKDNVLMGRPFDEERYRQVLQVCDMEQVRTGNGDLRRRAGRTSVSTLNLSLFLRSFLFFFGRFLLLGSSRRRDGSTSKYIIGVWHVSVRSRLSISLRLSARSGECAGDAIIHPLSSFRPFRDTLFAGAAVV